MQKIIPCLWFNGNAEDAVRFYTSLFKNSRITEATRYDAASAEASGQPEGSALTIVFELEGQEFMALNGGPEFSFSEAVSFIITCKDQEEVDYFWEKLTGGGGQESQCGWLKDRFGVSWQVVPIQLNEALRNPNPEKAGRAMKAMLAMKKIDIEEISRAMEGV